MCLSSHRGAGREKERERGKKTYLWYSASWVVFLPSHRDHAFRRLLRLSHLIHLHPSSLSLLSPILIFSLSLFLISSFQPLRFFIQVFFMIFESQHLYLQFATLLFSLLLSTPTQTLGTHAFYSEREKRSALFWGCSFPLVKLTCLALTKVFLGTYFVPKSVIYCLSSMFSTKIADKEFSLAKLSSWPQLSSRTFYFFSKDISVK